MPLPTGKYRFSTTVEGKEPFDVVVPKINEKMFQALVKVIERLTFESDFEALKKIREYFNYIFIHFKKK